MKIKRWFMTAVVCLGLQPGLTVWAATQVVSPGMNLAQVIWDAQEGDTILVNEGTYVAQATAYTPSDPVFHVIRNVTIRAQGQRENTILQVGAGRDQVIKVHPASYSTTSGASYLTNPDGAWIEGFTLLGDQGGVLIRDYQSLNGGTVQNVVLRDLDITVSTSAGTHGIELNNAKSCVIAENVIRSAYANGIYVYQGQDNMILDNTVQYTATQHGVAIQNSLGNQVVGNTVSGAHHAGVIMLNTTDTRVADNTLSGFGVDGITLTDGSKYNQVVNNSVVSDGWVAGRADGTGIWLNCNSNLNLVAGNSITGSPENGLTIFSSSNNQLLGNHVWGNYHGGAFIWDNSAFCTDGSFPGETPAYNYLDGNYLNYNPSNAQINIRGGINNQVAFNHLDGRDGFGGTMAGTNTGGVMLQTTSGNTVFGNTISHVNNGEYVYSDVSGTTFFLNRHFDTNLRYATSPAQVIWDGGSVLGGNFWSDFSAYGNPSSGSPYTDFVIDVIGNRGGNNRDNYPYQSESFGKSPVVTVLQPHAGQMLARGSRKTLRWQSSACVYVDLSYIAESGAVSTIAANYPDVGYYAWELPGSLTAGRGHLQIDCKDSGGNSRGASGISGDFTVSSGALILRVPGGEAVTETGSAMRIAWRQDSSAAVNVTLRYGDGSETQVASNVTDGFTDIIVPASKSGRAEVRIATTDGSVADDSDGPILIRQAGMARVLSPVGGARFQAGQKADIEWVPPPESVSIDIDVWNGAAWQAVASAFPDRGRYSWLIPALSTEAARVRISFRNLAGIALGSPVESGDFAVTGSGLTTGGVCAASMDSAFNLSVPIIQYGGLPLSAQLGFRGVRDGIMIYDIVSYQALIGVSSFAGCQPSTLSEELTLSIPSLDLNGTLFQATLRPLYEDGTLCFLVSDYGTRY